MGDPGIEDFDFSLAMSQVNQGLLVKPILENYLHDAQFPAFDLHFPKQEMHRDPDNWFHPSTHPTMKDRVLYQYIAAPESFPVEVMRQMNTLAVTIGKVSHEFIQMCMTDAGILPAEMQVCGLHPGQNCGEAGFEDPVLGERGHVDGLLDLEKYVHLHPVEINRQKTRPGLEFKTSHDEFGRLSGVADMDEAAFRKKWPKYWAQIQRYMRLSGRTWWIVLMMEMVYPFVKREFHIPFDIAFNAEIDKKYRDVRQAVADGRPPRCCGQRGCETALVCGVLR